MSATSQPLGPRDYMHVSTIREESSGAPESAGFAASTLAAPSHRLAYPKSPPRQDLFEGYKLFPNTNSLHSIDAQPTESSRVDGKDGFVAGARSSLHLPVNSRPGPHNLAVTCANRPNGTVLPEIPEQDFCPRSESHGPRQHGRIPSFHPIDSIGPSTAGGSRRARHGIVLKDPGCERSMENALSKLLGPEKHFNIPGADSAFLARRRVNPWHINSRQPSPAVGPNARKNCTVKGHVKTIGQDVGRAVRRCLFALPLGDASYTETSELRLIAAKRNEFPLKNFDHTCAPGQNRIVCRQVQAVANSSMLCSPPKNEPRTSGWRVEQSSSAAPRTSAHAQKPRSPTYLPLNPGQVDGILSLHSPKLTLKPPQTSSSTTELFLSQNWRSLRGTSDHIVSNTPALRTPSVDETLVQDSLDSVPIFRSNSLREYDCVENADTSICSSDSTSYSGSVLGIDLDLGREHASHNSATPTSSTVRQMYPLRQRSPDREVRKDLQSESSTRKSPRSITSSALPILLPVAVAAGIVRPNYATSPMSFYAPSGNLLRVENPTPIPWHASNSQDACANAPESPAHSVLLSATATPSASLPKHLQLQQYHHHARSRVVPRMIGLGTVKGGDGVGRRRSLCHKCGWRRSSSPAQCLRDSPSWRAAVSCSSLAQRKPSGGTSRGSRSAIGPLTGGSLRLGFCRPFDGAGEAGAACLSAGLRDRGINQADAHSPVRNARVVNCGRSRSLVAKGRPE